MQPLIIEGSTMGTTYRIVYFDEPEHRNFKASVDSLLSLVNEAISTYDPDSEISRFNKSSSGIAFELPYFRELLQKAKEIYKSSDGAFDPTVMPLVNAWGFGPEKSLTLPEEKLDSLRQLVGFDKINISPEGVAKSDPRVQLDFGGIGQGYGVDVLFQFLKAKGISDMLVELGGEGISLGKNLQKDRAWQIGILDPNSTPDHQFFKAYVTLHDQAFTTSGNYFNYKVIDGRKFGHTIDPVKGYPVQHKLLSASVFAPDCTAADGWATAFMVMGARKAIAKLKTLPDVDVLFICSGRRGKLKTYSTSGIAKQIVLEP
jgi:thiamine biosynthesis lipoprotein